MLNKDTFKKGVEMLITEFEGKGFTMTEKRAAQWYENMKHFTGNGFMDMIHETIRTIEYSPSMASVLKFQNEESKESTGNRNNNPEYLKLMEQMKAMQ